MAQPRFNLKESRFERIEVSGSDTNGRDDQQKEVRLRFRVVFPDHERETGPEFEVVLGVQVAWIHDGEEQLILAADARGRYAFEEGVDPYVVEDDCERVFAAGVLYSGLRPLLDSILAHSGYAGLMLPPSIPLSVMQKAASLPPDPDDGGPAATDSG